jgi:putative ABC transport system ATP-binding protein
MREALAATGLEAVVDRLPHGFETSLGPFGYPLSRSETLRLKLSAILLAEPRVLLITDIFDSVSPDRRAIFEHLRRVPGLTTLYFSNRRDLDVFDAHLFLGWERSYRFDSLGALCAFEANIGRLTERVA